MNRIFHSKVGWTFYLVLGILAVNMFYFFWTKEIVPAVLIALLELFFIEMIIHTRYVVTTDGYLKVDLGRFYPSSVIPVKDIVSLHASRSAVSSMALSLDKIKIVFRGKHANETVYVSPVKKKEMITLLLKLNDQIIIDENLKKILS